MGDQEESQLAEAVAQFESRWRNSERAALELAAELKVWWASWIVQVAKSQVVSNAALAKEAGADHVRALRTFAEGQAGQADAVVRQFVQNGEVLAHFNGKVSFGKPTSWSPSTEPDLKRAFAKAAGPLGRELVNHQLIPNGDSAYWSGAGTEIRYVGTIEFGDELSKVVSHYDAALVAAHVARSQAERAEKLRDESDALGLWNQE